VQVVEDLPVWRVEREAEGPYPARALSSMTFTGIQLLWFMDERSLNNVYITGYL
jgi:hypothetical protein